MADHPRAPVRYVLVAATVAVLSTIWYLVSDAADVGSRATALLAMPLGSTVSACAILALLRRGPLAGGARRFWMLQLWCSTSTTVAFSIFAGHALRHPATVVKMPVTAAIILGVATVVEVWSIVRLPVGVRSRAERSKQLLDQAITFLGGCVPLLTFGFGPMITARDRWGTQTVVMVGMAYLFAACAITRVAYYRAGPVDRAAVRLIASTGVVGVAAAVVAGAGGGAGWTSAQALVMPLVPVLTTLAVRRQWASPGTPRPAGQHWLPYLALAVVDVSLLAVMPGEMAWPEQALHLAVVLVTVLVAIRQLLSFQENARLLRDRRASQAQLQHEASHDGLTGLANRALFRERLAAQLATSQASVLLVDLDDFKTINDSLGHDVGDQLLIAVADVLRVATGDAGVPVRLGGDEFAVLLTDPTVLGECVAERILACFDAPVSEHRLLVHASIGIATVARGAPLDRVLRNADIAMYAAKQRGKANMVRYHEGMEMPVATHAQLGGELRRGLDAGEFTVVYQPIVALDSGQVVGVEALVRWQHPTRGLISPAEFIPAAESTGLIVPLGRFVLRESCRQGAAWLAEFGPDSLQKVGPNVSARQLHDPDFVTDVQAALDDAGLSPDRLVLELTESAVLRGPQVGRVLQELHDMGVRMALDDFGTGESSLSLLRAFPAAIIKLDKSFVDGIEADAPDSPASQARQAVARAVIQLAGALGLDSVAEGIENQEQAERLRRLGYTLGQGFHLARPMTPAAISKLLAAQRDDVTTSV